MSDDKINDARVEAGARALADSCFPGITKSVGPGVFDGFSDALQCQYRNHARAVLAAADAAGAQEAAPSGEAVAWVPPVAKSAPERIWLQVSDEPRHIHGEFPSDHDGITWCEDSALSCEVGYVRADLAHHAPAPAAVPAGYALVPVEPTPEMRAAAYAITIDYGDDGISLTGDEIEKVWAAMLSASPPPSQPPSAANEQKGGWICPKCGTDRTKASCPKGHSAALTGDCPMVGSATGGAAPGNEEKK